jgi:hypothetical protein
MTRAEVHWGDPSQKAYRRKIGYAIAGLSEGRRKGGNGMLILLIVLLLVLGGGGGYYGHSRWGYGGGAGIGLGTILLILLIAYMLGMFV